jgi:hypothetical protein
LCSGIHGCQQQAGKKNRDIFHRLFPPDEVMPDPLPYNSEG